MQENQIIMVVFQLIVLLFSIMIHEIAHGAMALYLGDDTAKRLGRLTLNPITHIDAFGSVILPFILSIPLFFGGSSIIVGWAKPVPYNPSNLADPKKGGALIAVAGPLSNIFLAVIFALLLHIPLTLGVGGSSLVFALSSVIIINLLLAIFNLIPIPPLDGSKIMFGFLSRSQEHIQYFLERYSFPLLLLFIFFGFDVLRPIVFFVFDVLLMAVGLSGAGM